MVGNWTHSSADLNLIPFVMTMTEEDKNISQLQKDYGILEQRVKFLEKIVYWFIGFVALNLIGSFILWISTLKN